MAHGYRFHFQLKYQIFWLEKVVKITRNVSYSLKVAARSRWGTLIKSIKFFPNEILQNL